MHRHLITLGLPKSMHVIANRLIRNLRSRTIKLSVALGTSLCSQIPWFRVLRPEVIAMAAVVILLRILFKFNDCFEVSLHFIPKFFRRFDVIATELLWLLL